MTAAAAAAAALPDDLMPREEDLLYEEELLRNVFNLKLWWRYLQARKDAPPRRRYLLYERALKALPGSFKLWHAYLRERREAVRPLPVTSPANDALLNTFERALVTMHKMPRIWLEYLAFATDLRLVTRARRAFDRALRSLPVTQHDRVWNLYLAFVRQPGIPADTTLRVYRRYLKLEPAHAEEFVAFLSREGHWDEAARTLARIVDDDGFVSLAGKSKHSLWLELCDLITKHPAEVTGLDVDAILRGGVRRFTDEVGRLWTALADYYIRRGLFEKARDVYEEGVGAVTTVRDFSLLFDAYTQFEESMLAAKMEALGEGGAPAPGEVGGPDGSGFLLADRGDDLDLRLARLELLMSSRPELLSAVMLRQNPHNVPEWIKRVGLFDGRPAKQVMTFTEAVKTVDPAQAVGKPHLLWVGFARFYADRGDLANARVVYEKAVKVEFKAVDDLASVWCDWAELELSHKNYAGALALMKRATAAPPRKRRAPGEPAAGGDETRPTTERLHRSLKVWSFYCDLEESLGTVESATAVYESILDLRIATPQVILNYALMLQEHAAFEAAFRVYERGVALFRFPHARDIWQAYLSHFVGRYGSSKLERARDLFEQALAAAPPADQPPLFAAYAALEETHGLARHALAVYERAARAALPAVRRAAWELYLAKTGAFFGPAAARPGFEAAVAADSGLSDADTRALCLQFAALERRLGEVDRARAIFGHGAQLADPRAEGGYWAEWNAFEVAHGNEETFREMLRLKRAVGASYSQLNFNLAALETLKEGAAAAAAASAARAAGGLSAVDDDNARRNADAMAALEAELAGAPQAGDVAMDSGIAGVPGSNLGVPDSNPEDIDIDGAEGAGGDAGAALAVEIETVAVPESVFGDLRAQVETEQRGAGGAAQAPMGALARFRSAGQR